MATQITGQIVGISPQVQRLAQKFIQNYLPLIACVKHHPQTLATLWGISEQIPQRDFTISVAKKLMEDNFSHASLNDGDRKALDSTLYRLEKVERWANYREWGGHENSLLHTVRDIFFIPHLANLEEEYGRKIDREILTQAFLLHDWGEIATQDTLWKHKDRVKTEASELEYFRQIAARIVPDSEERHGWIQAYLLQYAFAPEEEISLLSLEKEDKNLVLVLKRAYPVEAMIFNAAERLGYLCYAINCYVRSAYFPAMVQTLRNQQNGLLYLAEPGNLYSLRNHLFTRRIQRQAQRLITACDRHFLEV